MQTEVEEDKDWKIKVLEERIDYLEDKLEKTTNRNNKLNLKSINEEKIYLAQALQ